MNNSIGDQKTFAGKPVEVSDTLAPGTVLGQYRIVRLLGRGGMGEVYEAEHQMLRLRYALKLLPATLEWRGVGLERFQREAQVMANLDHPNILKVDDFGDVGGRYWLRMELAGGVEQGSGVGGQGSGKRVVSLQDLADARGGKIPQAELLGILKQIVAGLEYAHAHGAIHRDLKPANILLFPHPQSPTSPVAKIADFGLVRLVGEEWVRSQAQLSVQRSLSIGDQATMGAAESEGTSARSLLGTYEYMSPEQKRGEEVDARSDLYAVGLMTFKLLTRRNPGIKPPTKVDADLVPGWDELVESALEERSRDRCADGRAFQGFLEKIAGQLAQRAERERVREQQRAREEAARQHAAAARLAKEKKREEQARREAEAQAKARAQQPGLPTPPSAKPNVGSAVRGILAVGSAGALWMRPRPPVFGDAEVCQKATKDLMRQLGFIALWLLGQWDACSMLDKSRAYRAVPWVCLIGSMILARYGDRVCRSVTTVATFYIARSAQSCVSSWKEKRLVHLGAVIQESLVVLFVILLLVQFTASVSSHVGNLPRTGLLQKLSAAFVLVLVLKAGGAMVSLAANALALAGLGRDPEGQPHPRSRGKRIAAALGLALLGVLGGATEGGILGALFNLKGVPAVALLAFFVLVMGVAGFVIGLGLFNRGKRTAVITAVFGLAIGLLAVVLVESFILMGALCVIFLMGGRPRFGGEFMAVATIAILSLGALLGAGVGFWLGSDEGRRVELLQWRLRKPTAKNLNGWWVFFAVALVFGGWWAWGQWQRSAVVAKPSTASVSWCVESSLG